LWRASILHDGAHGSTLLPVSIKSPRILCALAEHCSCRWCQKETGASFALNAMIENSRLKITKGEPSWTMVPSHSGAGQNIARCPKCLIAVFSVYFSDPPSIQNGTKYVRVGTLDKPDAMPPDVQIWVSEKQPWIVLSSDIPVFQEHDYPEDEVWSKQGLERRRKLEG
jgi:hypothetical protein